MRSTFCGDKYWVALTTQQKCSWHDKNSPNKERPLIRRPFLPSPFPKFFTKFFSEVFSEVFSEIFKSYLLNLKQIDVKEDR
jgi:hypothetical protein